MKGSRLNCESCRRKCVCSARQFRSDNRIRIPNNNSPHCEDIQMRRWILTFLAAGCLFACLAVVSPKPASADEYWDGYWSWYDGTYSPYYTRRYYASPYSYSYGYPYAGSYYGPSYGVYP